MQFPLFQDLVKPEQPDELSPPYPAVHAVLSDENARAAALDIRRSWIVEAPAGSGKTGLLIQRFLRLLGESEITSPAEVLAITFTRKAAQELRNRVIEQLSAAVEDAPLSSAASAFDHRSRSLAQAVLQRDRALGWHLLEGPQHLNIRTIDSFCGELARSTPVLAGGVGQRQPVDDASLLYEEAAERVLLDLGGPDPVLDEALRCLLLHRDARVADCIALIAGMLAAREQWGELVPLAASELTEERLDGPVRRQLEQTLELIVSEGLSRAEASLPAGWLADLSAFAARVSAEPGSRSQPSPLGPCAGLPAPPGTQAADHERWLILVNLVLTKEGAPRAGLNSNLLGFELPKTAKPELQQLIARLRATDELGSGSVDALCSLRDLPATTLSEDAWVVLKAAFHVLRRALVELEILFAANGVCDFTSLSLTARQLLDADLNPSADFQQPGLRLQHLLVDEMQDTSVGQYQLFERLTRSWDGFSQTVFLVGDPKQSIYAFRQARVERFLRTQRAERLGDVPLGALRLTANFRSQAELVHAFNHAFSSILPPPEELAATAGNAIQTVEVPFTAAVPVRSAAGSPALHWHARISDPDFSAASSESSSETAAEADARSMRLSIEAFLERWQRNNTGDSRSRPPRIAVLARNRAHLGPAITELKRNHGKGPLRFRAVEVEVLNERPEVLDLMALTRALLHPGDRVAWLAILRSPVCGLSLADLLTLTGEGPDAETTATVAHLVRQRHGSLSVEGQRLLERAWPILQSALDTLGTSSLPTHVERTWRSLGADAILDANSLANARRFLLLLHDLEASQSLDLGNLERRLRKLYAEDSDPAAVVELMTIHKSKGLEWDLVLVPALERGSGRPDTELLRWFELDVADGGGSSILLAPISAKGEEGSRLWRWLGRLKIERELAESKRLLYVACTRAREELHLFGTVKLTKTGALQTPVSASLLRAAWPAAMPAFQRALEDFHADTTASPDNIVQTQPDGSLLAFPSPEVEFMPPLSLAAAADGPAVATQDPLRSTTRARQPIERLPSGWDPLARFHADNGPHLSYPPASSMRSAAPFSRPEGSFAARAFGNVVHRFLDLIARKLEAGETLDALSADLPQWSHRIYQAFRAEGLASSLCERETARAVRGLRATIGDSTGSWLLAPHQAAWTERTLQFGTGDAQGGPPALRADRVFLAGAEPLSRAATHLWIVDFKTTEQGGRLDEAFFAGERQKYTDQLQTYAHACLAAGEAEHSVVLALFYPLLTRMVYWPFSPKVASEVG